MYIKKYNLFSKYILIINWLFLITLVLFSCSPIAKAQPFQIEQLSFDEFQKVNKNPKRTYEIVIPKFDEYRNIFMQLLEKYKKCYFYKRFSKYFFTCSSKWIGYILLLK
jgi:hypothetical protein